MCQAPIYVIFASEAEKAGTKVGNHKEGAQINFAFIDADVIEEGTLAAGIGCRKIESREPSFMQEKVSTTFRNLICQLFVTQLTLSFRLPNLCLSKSSFVHLFPAKSIKHAA
uniref:Uncharacterized protein n=1 Tax=Aegilops tauschii subsp. strangulata TaxID=200361 RepID=A0A453RJT7_AEGTS